MTQRAARACRSVWERRRPRWLVASAMVVIVAVVFGVLGASWVSAGPGPLCPVTGPINVAPAIVASQGTGRVGTTLSRQTAGQWRAFCTPGANISGYQWYRGLTAISGATGTSYTTTSADARVVLDWFKKE